MYPMNALVEDQLTRLRKALDSKDARKWFMENSNGNMVYLGRYNGSTPVPGQELGEPSPVQRKRTANWKKIDVLTKFLKEYDNASAAAIMYAHDPASTDPFKEDAPFFFPRIDGAEMRSRWDMKIAHLIS